MANKKNKKKVQNAEATQAKAQAKSSASVSKAVSKKEAKEAKKARQAKAKKDAKPGFIARTKKYFASVRSEMKRVTWPSKSELINFSVAVIASLVVVGVVIAVLDMGISGLLSALAGLRG